MPPPPLSLQFRRGEAEEKARKAKFERKQRGKRRRQKKTLPDVSPHGPTAVVAEERPKRSRNVNKEINRATMTFFYLMGLGWGRACVYRATAVTGKPAALSVERQVKKRQEWDGKTSQE